MFTHWPLPSMGILEPCKQTTKQMKFQLAVGRPVAYLHAWPMCWARDYWGQHQLVVIDRLALAMSGCQVRCYSKLRIFLSRQIGTGRFTRHLREGRWIKAENDNGVFSSSHSSPAVYNLLQCVFNLDKLTEQAWSIKELLYGIKNTLHVILSGSCPFA